MNVIDILILLTLVFYLILGFRDGFMKKLFGILGFWGGLIIATKFMVSFSEVVKDWLGFSDQASVILAFSAIFVPFSVIVNLGYRWYGRAAADAQKIGSRAGGAALGIIQGLVAVSLVLVMLSIYDYPTEDAKQESMLYEASLQVAPTIFDYSTQWIPESKAFLEELESIVKSPEFKR